MSTSNKTFYTRRGPLVITKSHGCIIDATSCGPAWDRGIGALNESQTVELRQTLNEWFPVKLSDEDVIEFTQLYHDNLNNADQKSAGFAIKAMRDALQALFKKTGA